MKDKKTLDVKRDVDYIIKKVAGNNTEINSIENWGIGALNSTYRVTIKGSLNKYFLKIENDNIIPSTRRGQIEREVKGIEFMYNANIPCPVILRYDCSKKDIGKKYMLQEFIESDLLWEIKDTLTSDEREYIKIQITDIMNKMRNIKSDYFGDIYENGTIGQYCTWKEAYSAMWKLLLEDAVTLAIFRLEELHIVSSVLETALKHIRSSYFASFNHGDLGKHNVLTGYRGKYRSIGTVIDFGNSIFTPFYMNEDGIYKYGGWDLDALDICKEYSISKIEYDTNNLVFDFEGTLFAAMLQLKIGKDPRPHIDRFLENCRHYMQIN